MNAPRLDHPAALVDLDGKVALITGAASGIGRAQAELFLAAGAHVIALDIDSNGLDRLSTAAGCGPDRLLCLRVDLTDPAQVAQAVSSALEAFGQIDILCNTAGLLDGFTRSLDTDESLWDRVFEVNVKSMARLTNAVLPGMLQRQAGVIVNMASVAAFKAGAGGAAYTSSKHAVVGFTRQLSLDYGQSGIRANAICPGMIDTAMTSAVLDDAESARVKALKRVPAGRLGQPEDIARVALFLCGPGADFIHGTTIVVDGGLMVR
jgi:3-oxoacyl-[acyl-carrier protein] reductase